ncbi:MAG: sensor histidine kinase [Acidimicrobiales bacterium]
MKVLRSRSQVLDGVVAVVAAALGVVLLAVEAGPIDSEVTAFGIVGALIAGGALVVRRRYPVAVLVLVAVVQVLVQVDTSNGVALYPAVAVALYTVARSGEGRGRLLVAIPIGIVVAVIGAGLEAFAATAGENERFGFELPGALAQTMLPIALGEVMRSRAERIRELIDAEADARVQDERLRIARDLHDVVAHGLSAMTVQSGIAAHLLDGDVDQAREALTAINTTGKRSLEDLRTMVGVLRSSDGVELRPTPTDPDDYSELVSDAADAGVAVTIDVSGRFPADVSDASVVAVHRIVQEALTNVARHAGPVPARVSLFHGEDEVRVTIRNELSVAAGPAVPSTGVGIVGMTERAETLGGSLTVGPYGDGGHEVVAVVPYYRRSQ